MRQLAAGMAVFAWGCTLASAQSLADVADKEKKRRSQMEVTDSERVAPVIDNERLEQTRGDQSCVMEVDPPSASTDAEDAHASDDPDGAIRGDAGDPKLSEAEIRDYRETWARVWAKRLAAAERELELAEDAVFQCQSAAHYVYVPLAVDCHGVFERKAIADYVLDEVRQNRFNWELLLPETTRPPPQP